jgi:ABC-type multidrug transport system ATPase subunit
MHAIGIHDIEKSYPLKKGKTEALRGISFNVEEGQLFGLIGPDGAGKTTLFRILTTLLLADKGHATVNGFDVVKDFLRIRREVGYMPGRFSLYTDLTVEENLNFFANIFNTTVKENYHLIRDIYNQIEPFKHFRAGKLSGGMKQKLALSCALIHRPRTLFLDEPTTGVDAVSRKEFWELLRSLRAEGITILVSTPYMDEASLCDRVALIQDGRIMQEDTPDGLRRSFGRRMLAVRGPDVLHTLANIRKMPQVEDAYPFGEVLHVVLRPDAGEISFPEGVEATEAAADIEDCFISLMKTHDRQSHHSGEPHP